MTCLKRDFPYHETFHLHNVENKCSDNVENKCSDYFVLFNKFGYILYVNCIVHV